jgi:glutathione peroxidase
MFEKANASRLADNPLYADLVARTGQSPRWNFHKYLIDRTGGRVASYPSAVEPRELAAQIENLLADKPPPERRT